MKYQVFISYRRTGGEVLGRMLYEELIRRGYSVFYDVESLRSGPFNIKLYQVIDECTDVLVLLSPGGLDRCSDPEDWVRKEIAYALQKKKNVIPIIMRGFSFQDTVLPDDLEELPNMNGIEANMELFPAVMQRLAEKMMHSKPKGMNADREKVSDTKEKDNGKEIVAFILLVIMVFFPFFCRHFYTEQAWMPGPINQMLMIVKTELVMSRIFQVLAIGLLIIAYNGSLTLRRHSPITAGLELCDFEKSIGEFLTVIINYGVISRMRITKEEKRGSLIEKLPFLDTGSIDTHTKEQGTKTSGIDALAEVFAWRAEEKGMLIGSCNGDKPDYILVSFPQYKGVLEPLYLSRFTMKFSAVLLLTDQGFTLEWQKADRACYKNGEWIVKLSFGGIFKTLLVMELIRGERNSLLDIITKEAEEQTLSGELRKEFLEIRNEWNASMEKLKNGWKRLKDGKGDDLNVEEETEKTSKEPSSQKDPSRQSDIEKTEE